MVTDTIDVELAPGHRLTGANEVEYSGPVRRIGPMRYSCSCGELTAADTAAAQAHSDEVTP